MRRGCVFGLLATFALPALAQAEQFEPGQRWICVTDQNRDGYLLIHAVQGDLERFSWAVRAAEGDGMDMLCNKRDDLSVSQIRAFCQPARGANTAIFAELIAACKP